ncbi:MAG: GvpL/GvpF family gas vesicle protein [Anaerolineales bacterium]|nr:GvpL/GvpF family gas vesicle protein [Anaerolineales bacterium]
MSEAQGRYVYCIIPATTRSSGATSAWTSARLCHHLWRNQHWCTHAHRAISGGRSNRQGLGVDARRSDRRAWAETGSVLPMTFDCIIRPVTGHAADETVAAWLQAEYDNYRAELNTFAGKVELGVQVLWQTDAIAEALVTKDPEIRQLQQEMGGKPKGMAYFYQQKVEKAVKQGLETKADDDFRRYYRLITAGAEDVHVNKVKRPGRRQADVDEPLPVGGQGQSG